MKPSNIEIIGDDLAIKWDDGSESFVPTKILRRHCPCAGCHGETDILGNVYKTPDAPLPATAFRLITFKMIGGYAIQPVWGDGHSTGIFSWDYLSRLPTQ